MRHVLYALFRERNEADAAVHEVQAAGLPRDQCELVVHEGKINKNDLRHSESDARKGLVGGLLTGCLGGAVLGWLLAGPLSVLPMNAIIAALCGLVLGGVGGTLSGAGLADRDLEALSEKLRAGQVLITAEIKGAEARATVEQIFRRHGELATT